MTVATLTPTCQGCRVEARNLAEYVDDAAFSGMPVDEYMVRHEGTYNASNGHFLCSPCYIDAGMPVAGGAGWKCP